jgi:hypothetical protein
VKVLVTIKLTQTGIFETGDLPITLIRDLLVANDGSFDGNWGLGDVARGSEKYVTDEVTVEPLPVKKAKA